MRKLMDPDPKIIEILTQLLILFVLTFVNAFFSGSEMAVVSVNKNKIKMLAENGNKNAILIEKLMQDSTVFLSTIQVAITMAGFFSSATAATGIAQIFGDFLLQFRIPYSQKIAGVLVTIILAFVNLVLGELVPKKIALQKAEAISLLCVRPIYFLSKIINPFIKLLSISTRGFLKMIRMYSEDIDEQVTEEEIRAMIKTGTENGVFNDTEKEMITSIFSFDDKWAREIMTPRHEIIAIDLNDSTQKNLDLIIESRHSRIPVYSESMDNIIGIISTTELMIQARKKSFEEIDLSKMMTKPYFVPESRRTDELFKDMQRRKTKIAILLDEYGGVSGMVTLQDLVSEVFGEVKDEFDDESEPEIRKLAENVYDISGSYSIFDLNEKLSLKIQSECNTLSGYLIEKLGFIPEVKNLPIIIETTKANYSIENLDGKVINRIKVFVKLK